MNEQVTDYINNVNPDWQKALCERPRDIIFQADPEIEERLLYKTP